MKRALKRVGIAAGVLAAIPILALSGLFAASSVKLSRKVELQATSLTISPPAPASPERGQHLVVAITKCAGCHGGDLGGAVFEENGAFGRWAGPNLTSWRYAPAASYTDADWVRALRHGVAKDGRALRFMPSHEYRRLSEQDLADIVAYVRGVPPVQRTVPENRVGPILRMLYVRGLMPLVSAQIIDHSSSPPAAPAVADDARYGEYLAHIGDCFGCHGAKLDGENGMPGAANLTALPDWREADFVRALRTGKRPDGTVVKPEMPWQLTAQMSDLEVNAVAKYLVSVQGGVTK